MNKHCKAVMAMAGVLLASWGLNSCQMRPVPEAYVKMEKPEYIEGTFEHFVYTTKDYPRTMETYRNWELLKRANSRSKVYICLDQQRGRLYVEGQVAADWPVSTGVSGRETPTGNYSVVEKKKEYASNTYGNIYDARNKMVKYNAELPKDEGLIPEGGEFRGSPMPNWMRLTWDGMGMHTGKVEAGKRLSHGCIRTPGHMASQLFDIVGIGTKVTVGKAIEPYYPAMATMAMEDCKAEAAREQAIKDANAARLKQWETDNPRAARRYAERQAKLKAAQAPAPKANPARDAR